MLDRLKQLLVPPLYEDEDTNNTARLLHIILLTAIGLVSVLLAARLLLGATPLFSSTTFIIGTVIIVLMGIFILSKQRLLQPSIYALVTITWLGVTLLAWTADGVKDSAFMAYLVIILVASLLSGWRLAVFFIGLTIITGWLLVAAETYGLIAAAEYDPANDIMIDYSFILALSGILIYLIISNLQNALLKSRQSNMELQRLSNDLENQVRVRTQALETSVTISRQLTMILDQRELAAEVVQQVQAAFNYYHAQIYLYDEARENLVLFSGTGEAGKALMARHHQIKRGMGLVGQAASNNKVVLVPDTQRAPEWLPNPLLPDTRAEIAVPIALGDEVLGVLDIQHRVRNGLTKEDAELLQSVANQVAVAWRNAQMFAETRRKVDQEIRINAIGQEIRKAADIESVLQTAVRELGQALGAPRTTVLLDQKLLRKKHTDNQKQKRLS